MPIVLAGATSGSTTINATDAVTATLTLPNATGTLISTASSGQVIPKAALPTGSVLQVVSATIGTSTSTSSSIFVTSAITLSITPTSASSKIFISAAVTVDTEASGRQGATTIFRNSTNLATGLANNAFNDSYNTGGRLISAVSMQYLDSPATTSSTTYTIYFSSLGGGSVSLNVGAGSTITVMEIAA